MAAKTKIWTQYEDSVLSNTSLTYDTIHKKFLPHRSKRSIWSRASKLGYLRNTSLIRQINSENQRKKEWTSLLDDKEFCEIIDGELLGDGCIYRKKVKNRQCYEYSFIAGSIHKDYAQYLHGILSKKLGSEAKIGICKPKYRKDFGWSKTFYSVRFSNVVFNPFYERWYPHGSIKTTVPDDLKLTPKVCLHWYMGDGSLDCRLNKKMFDLSLHTENFEDASINILIEKMSTSGFDMKKKASSKKYTLLRIHGNKARSFLAYMGKSPVKSLSYKWRDWSSDKE